MTVSNPATWISNTIYIESKAVVAARTGATETRTRTRTELERPEEGMTTTHSRALQRWARYSCTQHTHARTFTRVARGDEVPTHSWRLLLPTSACLAGGLAATWTAVRAPRPRGRRRTSVSCLRTRGCKLHRMAGPPAPWL